MERSHDGKAEYRMCMTYEPEQKTDECCGASGRKLRQVCIYCPNYDRYKQRKKQEGKENENEKSD